MADIRLSLYVPFEEPEPHLTFAAQIGADRVYSWVPERLAERSHMIAFRQRVEDAGLEVHNLGCIAHGKDPSIHLALADRDERIDRFAGFVSELGESGVSITTFTWEPDQVWSSSRGASRGASSRRVVESELVGGEPTHGRSYEREELWDNFGYFIDRIAPACRESGVRLALHPNDPPVTGELGGIPCLIHRRDDYERAFALAPAEVLGMEFCCGCWLEGGSAFGNAVESIEQYARDGRILLVHFRNVSETLPGFTETFLDNGYGNMKAFIDALRRAGYTGTVTPDHVPTLVEPYGAGASYAYAAGYIRALLQFP